MKNEERKPVGSVPDLDALLLELDREVLCLPKSVKCRQRTFKLAEETHQMLDASKEILQQLYRKKRIAASLVIHAALSRYCQFHLNQSLPAIRAALEEMDKKVEEETGHEA